MDMFGLIVTGRLVDTDFQQVAENRCVINIPDADDINHVVVFMTGKTPFPDRMGGAVYFGWPSSGEMAWQLLGIISNDKPSAVFKVSNLKQGGDKTLSLFGQMAPGHQHHVAQIGISVHPMLELLQQTPANNTTPSTVNTFVEFSQKMLENLFNYAASFAINQSQMTPNPTETFVPVSCLQQWYTNFERRLLQNPNFWKS